MSSDEPVLWLKFLDTIFNGDAKLIAFMHRVCGYALTGHTRKAKLLLFYESGSNGKSIFLKTIQDIIGDYAKAMPSSLIGEKKSKDGNKDMELADLFGARLVVNAELPTGLVWDDKTIKDLTGGDKITWL